jgi:hypothetical protein
LIKIKIWDTYFRIILMSFFVYSKMIMSFQWIFFYSPLSMTLTIYFKVNYNQYCFVSFIYNWKVSLESYLCYVWKMLEKLDWDRSTKNLIYLIIKQKPITCTYRQVGGHKDRTPFITRWQFIKMQVVLVEKTTKKIINKKITKT